MGIIKSILAGRVFYDCMVVKATLPFYLCMIITLLLITFVPAISLWLPQVLAQ